MTTNNSLSLTDSNFSVPSTQEITEIASICNTLGKTPYYQKLGAGGCLAIWLTAREMGLPPMAGLNGLLWTFDGKVTISAQGLNMCIVKKGHRADIIESNDDICKIRFVRCDRPEGQNSLEWEYTIEQAKKAKLTNKQNWMQNPKDMLFNRCLMSGARKFMPDVTLGLYSQEELQDCQKIEQTKTSSTVTLEHKEEDTPQAKANNLLMKLLPDQRQYYLDSWKEHFNVDGPLGLEDQTAMAMCNRFEKLLSSENQ